MSSGAVPGLVRELFVQLQRRRFPLGPENYADLLAALHAGFGWESPEALRRLLCALWAKSPPEERTLTALFEQLREQYEGYDWALPVARPAASEPGALSGEAAPPPSLPEPPGPEPQRARLESVVPPVIEPYGGFPPILRAGIRMPDHHFIFIPDFPVTYRETAQAWRRLRQPVREGPPVELDVRGTINRYTRQGVATGPMLAPRRRNTASLLLLVDRGGSMAPFHAFVDEVCAAIRQSGNLRQIALYYFDNCPVSGAPNAILETLRGELFPKLDPILPDIEPFAQGELFTDPALHAAVDTSGVICACARDTAVVIISDGGAARGHYNVNRLLETMAFLRAVRVSTRRIAWLNPLPKADWTNNTAGETARHTAMFPLDRSGMYAAVDHLRGRPVHLESPL